MCSCRSGFPGREGRIHAFYRAAFGLGPQLRVRASQEPTTGFRGFTMSVVAAQPDIVDLLIGAALDNGATPIKPVARSLWAMAAWCRRRTGPSGRSPRHRRGTAALRPLRRRVQRPVRGRRRVGERGHPAARVVWSPGLLIVYARIDSFIATLGMSSVLLAGVQWISSSQQILDLGEGFQKIGTGELLGITYPVYIMLAIGAVVYYVLERTPVGRRVYATGGNIDAARLAGVNITRVTILSFVACGVLAATAGVLTSSRLATGDPTTGPSFLLPAFAAAFLGSTQFRGGRYNVAGTIVATYVLATGVKDLQLAGAPVWIPDLFNGAALLLAVGLAKYQGTAGRGAAIGRMLRRKNSADPAAPAFTTTGS